MGLSPVASWNGTTCSNLYCHGTGRADNGTMAHTAGTPSCSGCHADRSSGRSGWDTMSGEHEDHLRQGVVCSDCHADTVQNGQQLHGIALHVDGKPNVAFAGGTITRSGGTCTGSCHGEPHASETWN